jgi:hypothetical protein
MLPFPGEIKIGAARVSGGVFRWAEGAGVGSAESRVCAWLDGGLRRMHNYDGVHNGRLTKGRTPAEVLGAAKMWR